MLTGTNGILTQAQLAKSETEKAAARESLEIKRLGAKTENSTESIEDSLSKMDNVEITSKTKDGVLVKCNGNSSANTTIDIKDIIFSEIN